jgi:cytochrome c oxidase subunit 3
MNQSVAGQAAESVWGGGIAPFATSWQKLMMWIFIVTDALLFAGLLVGYGVIRVANGSWPHQPEVFHMNFIALMTFTLITSSLFMASAVGGAQAGRKSHVTLYVWLTILGGLSFLGMQAYEWSTLIHEGARLTSNPWGIPQFGSCFFIITGFHGMHVVTGVTILLVVAIRSALGRYSAEGVEIAGLYWHFVDLVWVFIFAFFYLI